MADGAGQKHWFRGLPFPGLANGTLDAGTMQYWRHGLPVRWIGTVVVPVFGDLPLVSGVSYLPVSASAVWASAEAWSADHPVTALSDLINIREIAQATDSGQRTLTFVLPAAVSIQFIAMIHHNGVSGTRWRIRLFSDDDPDIVGNAGAIVDDSGILQVWPSDPGELLYPSTRPHLFEAPVTARSGHITLYSRASIDNQPWEIGGFEIAQWWPWTDVEVPRERGMSNTDVVSEQPDSVDHVMKQWAPRIWSGSRGVVDQAELETTAIDFMRDRGLTKPFVFVWNINDPATWLREAMLVRNTKAPPAVFQLLDIGRIDFKFTEHLG
jgi:hypothetical protein